MDYCKNPIYYHDRKKGAKCDELVQSDLKLNADVYNNSENLKNSGREFMANDETFQYIESLMGRVETNIVLNEVLKPMTFIYLISKEISGQVYMKLGLSEKANFSRISGAQTFLIPGLNADVGFSVHFLYYFKNDNIGTKDIQINHYIEQNCHILFRHFFKAANIRFGTDNPSEWYLIPRSNITYFCGFVLDVIATFAFSHDKFKPKYIWKLSKVAPVMIDIPLPEKEDVVHRLKMDPGYKAKFDLLIENKGLRNIPVFDEYNTIEIEDVGDNILENSKGTAGEMYKKLGIKNDFYKDGRYFTIPANSKKTTDTYLLVDVKKNTFKFALGQPLKTGELYGIIRKKEANKDIDIAALRKNHNIWLIPADPDKNFNFIDYYIEMGDLLPLLKPENEDEFDRWVLKSNYEYYLSRESKTTYKFRINQDRELPTWYFQKNIQEHYAKIFITDKSNKYTHDDTSVLNDNGIKYNWKLTGNVILKERIMEEKDKQKKDTSRSSVFVSREGTEIKSDNLPNTRSRKNVKPEPLFIMAPTITEDVPVIRLMYLFREFISKESFEKDKQKPLKSLWIQKNKISLEKDTSIKIRKSAIVTNVEDGNDESIVTFQILHIYSSLYGSFIQGQIVHPLNEDQIFNISQEILGAEPENTISLIPYPKLSVNNIIKIQPSKLADFGNFEEITNKKEFQYAKITGKKIAEEYMYEIEYFPPWNERLFWPIPLSNTQEIRKGAHSDPTAIHTESFSAKDIDKLYGKVIKENDPAFKTYLKKLKMYKLKVDKILGHSEEYTQFKVLFGNRSIGEIPANEVPPKMLADYMKTLNIQVPKKTKRKTNKKGGRQIHHKSLRKYHNK